MTIIVATLLALAAPAVDPVQDRDLRCIATIAYAISKVDDVKRKAIIPLATYYIGRVTARDPRIDLEKRIVDVIGDQAEFLRLLPSELTRCGKELEQVGTSLTAIGEALQRRGTEPRR